VPDVFRGRDLAVLGAGLVVLAVATALLRLIPAVSHTTVALLFLLLVLGIATVGRRRIAIVMSVVAMLAFNYFFLPPVHTFTIAAPENLIALFVFLVVAIVASSLSTLANERAREAIARRNEVTLVRQKADLAATLLASVSHDLRTPLTAIKVAIENLRGELSGDERNGQAALATAEIDRLTRLIQDILDMARVDAGAIVVTRQWVSPAEVVDAATAHVHHALAGHPLEIEADGDRLAEIDPRLTSAALSHLLENAAQYSPHGSPIAIEARAEGEGLIVTVIDRGPGLNPDELDRLFERFYRGHSARDISVGTGMGLSITRGLLTAAGGRVWAENVSGVGARFSMVVPGAVRAAAALAE
jgi:K+-sensing histidine kinase KdpD